MMAEFETKGIAYLTELIDMKISYGKLLVILVTCAITYCIIKLIAKNLFNWAFLANLYRLFYMLPKAKFEHSLN